MEMGKKKTIFESPGEARFINIGWINSEGNMWGGVTGKGLKNWWGCRSPLGHALDWSTTGGCIIGSSPVFR